MQSNHRTNRLEVLFSAAIIPNSRKCISESTVDVIKCKQEVQGFIDRKYSHSLMHQYH